MEVLSPISRAKQCCLNINENNSKIQVKWRFVRIADIYLFSFEGPLCSPSFEFERYDTQAHYANSDFFRFKR